MRDFNSSACLISCAGVVGLKALDPDAGENENDSDSAFLTVRRREYPPHIPHRYLVAARWLIDRSDVRMRSPLLSMSKNSIEQPSMHELRPALCFITKSIHAYLIDYPVAIVLMVAPFLLKLGKSSPVALCFRW